MEPSHLNLFPQPASNITDDLNDFFDEIEKIESQPQGVMEIDAKSTQDPTMEDLGEILARTPLAGREQKVEELWEHILSEARRFNQTAPVDAKLFATINGGPEIIQSSYEGISPQQSARFLVSILQLIHVGNERDQQEMQLFIADLKKFIEIDQKLMGARTLKSKTKLAQENSAMVSALKPGERLLLPGGIAGTPGHFVLYEIRDTIFRIYNTGLDCDKIQPRIDINSETYVFPYHEIDQIDLQKLRSVAFHRMLIELTTRKNISPELSFEDIARYLRKMLLGRSAPLNFSAQSMRLRPHKAGTCGWSAFITYGKVRLEFDYFKQIYFQIKFWSVPQFFLTFNQTTPSLSQKKLFIRSLYALAKRPAKIYGDSQYNAKVLDDYILIHTLLKKTNDWLTGLEIPYNRYKPNDILMESVTVPSSLLLYKNDTPFALDTTLSYADKIPKLDKKAHFSLPQQLNAGTFLDNIRKWNQLFFKLRESNISECGIKINLLFRNLPVPSAIDSWNETETVELEEIFKQLTCLAEIYRHPKTKTEIEPSKDVLNHFHLFALLDSLAVQLSKKGLSDLSKYGIHIPLARLFFSQYRDKGSSIHSHSLVLSDFADQHRFKLIENYFQLRNHGKEKNLFDYPIKEVEVNQLLVDQSIWQRSADFDFIHEYLENDPSIEKRVAAEFEFEGELSRPFLLARLFTSHDSTYLPLCYVKLREFHANLIVVLYDKYVDRSDPYCIMPSKNQIVKACSESRKLFIFFISVVPDNIGIFASAKQLLVTRFKDQSLYDPNKHVEFNPYLSPSHENLIAVYGGLTTNQGLYLKNKAFPPDLETSLCPPIRANAKTDESIEFSQLSRMIDIRTTDKLSLSICLKYYQDNLELLERPTHRQFLKYTLLEQGKLLDAIVHSPAILSSLQQFTEAAACYYFKNTDKIETSLFLIHLFCSLQTLDCVFPDLNIKFVSIPALKSLLEKYINSSVNESSNQVYGSLFSTIIKIHFHRDAFDIEDVNWILRAWLELNKQDLDEDREMAKYYFYSIESKIIHFLKDTKQRDQLINELASKFMPKSPIAGKWEGKYPIYTCGEWSFDILNGGFFKNNVTYSYLTPNQTSHDVLKNLFEVKPRDLFIREDNVYTSEEKGLRVVLDSRGIIQQIKKKVGERWVIHVKYLQQLYHLFNNRYGWLYEEEEGSFINIENESGEPLYRLQFQSDKHPLQAGQSERGKRKASVLKEDLVNYNTFVVINCQTNLQLLNVKDMDEETRNTLHPIIKKLLNIFHPSGVLIWINPLTQMIEKIELSVCKLSFSLKSGYYKCDQMNGLHLFVNDHYSPFQTYRSYFVLEGLDNKILCRL